MPEGDTIHRTAVTLRRALVGRVALKLEFTPPTVLSPARCAAVGARTIASVESAGKHLLIVFRSAQTATTATTAIAAVAGLILDLRRNDLVLHTHMGMRGSWHIYRSGESWRKSPRGAGLVVHTDTFVAPCFSPQIAELLTADEVAHHPRLRRLGADLARDPVDVAIAVARLRGAPDAEIGVVLMDQRSVAGVGNVYKSEVLFIARVSPFARVADLDDDVLARLVTESQRLVHLNLSGHARRTVPGLNPRERLWVYGRSGRPCRKCGDTIRMRRQGALARSTYYCPTCQLSAAGAALTRTTEAPRASPAGS
jgi:endonuclease-8